MERNQTSETVGSAGKSIIRIARPGHDHWHNQHIGIEFYEYVCETANEFKLAILNDELWINKSFVDVRSSATNWEWVPSLKVQSENRPISQEEAAVMNNPLLMSMAETFNTCLLTAIAKNNDYGGSNNDPFANFRNSTIAGVSVEKGILVRLMDKMSRVSTLLDKEAMVKDEAITDTIEDAINYLAIMKAYINLKNK